MPPWKVGEAPLGARAEGPPHAVIAKSLAKYARDRTRNGRELVDFMLQVMRGEPLPVRATRARRARYPQTPKVEHRLVAAQWLANRGWGKAKELVELTGDATTTPEQRLALLRRLSDDERATLRGLLAKALATPEAPGPSAARAQADLEPEDPVGPPEVGAPATHGRPRNVGRALAPEVVESELGQVEVESPADSPADLDKPAPA
jgi:hypothetical protein